MWKGEKQVMDESWEACMICGTSVKTLRKASQCEWKVL